MAIWDFAHIWRASEELAEREGFEPPIPVKVYTLSRRAPSATRPSLRAHQFHFYFIRGALRFEFPGHLTELSPAQPPPMFLETNENQRDHWPDLWIENLPPFPF